MPSPGVVNNPEGANSYEGVGGRELAYGAVKRLEQTSRGLPRNPALNEPRRSKKRAVQGQQVAVAPPETQVQMDPDALRADFWATLAAMTDDDLVREYATVYTGL